MPPSPLRAGDSLPPRAGAPRVPGLELGSPLGSGPRATVWEARTARGTDVAVKIFRSSLSSRPGFVVRFEKETATLAALVHPHVVPVLDRGVADGSYFLVSPRLPSGSIATSLVASALPARRAVQVAIAICEALDVAHRRGLVHRNLVAENVFFDERDEVRVADFGLTMLEAEPPPADARGDLRAVGELLFRLLTGTRQRVGVALGASVLAELPRLEELLARALGSELPGYARASELALALRLALSGARSEAPEGLPTSAAAAAKEPISLSVTGRVVSVRLSGDADLASSTSPLRELGATLGRPGPWRLAYELDPSASLEDALSERLQGLHLRSQRNIEKIAFSSGRALTRASLIGIGAATRQLPFKVFATRAAMMQWLEAAS